MNSHRSTARAAAAASLLACAIAFAGCSAGDSAKQTEGTAAPDTASSVTAAPDGSSQAAAQPASDDAAFPVYPNAKSQPIPARMRQVETCGHKQTIAQYAVDADGKAVVDWYEARIPNAVAADVAAAETDDSSDALDKNLEVELMQPGRSAAMMVVQMHFRNAGLQAASKTIDMDKTTISFTHFDPPLGSKCVHRMSQMAGNDANARAAAKAQLGELCPQG